MYMANTRPNARGLNTNHISLAGVGDFALGVTQILYFTLGETYILAFLDTNMLASPTRNYHVGGLDQRKTPTREFCVAVEYRLYESSREEYLYFRMCRLYYYLMREDDD